MDNNKNFDNFLGYMALLSFFGATGFFFGALQGPDPLASIDNQLAAAATAVDLSKNFDDVTVTANAAYVYDVSLDEEVFDKNGQSQLPLASITKATLALLAHEHLRADGTITFSASSLLPEGDSGFEVGESWVVRDLIDFTLMTSSNDGAAALAEAVERATNEDIVSLLNDKSKELGLQQTYFVNETGLDSSELFSGAYGSPRDVAILFSHIYKTAPDLLAATTIPELTFTNIGGTKTYEATNTNKGISDLPGLVFGKTGFTDLAGGNLAVVTESEPGHAFVVVVLGSTLDERFDDVITLVHATLQEPTE